jgi:sensor histidine kinase YesM
MKHPVLGNNVLQIIWWLVWLFLALGQSLFFYLIYGNFSILSVADSTISALIYSGLSLTLWYPFMYFKSGSPKISSVISNHTITGAISVSLWILITRFILNLIMKDQVDFQAYWDTTLPYRIGTGIFIYSLVVLTYYLVVSLSDLSERKAREARLESVVKETELRLLRSQINPHFLFNSLNSISSLTITDPERAREMIVKLSEFMRYALSRKDEQPVSLRHELENLLLYLDIEKVRFGDKLITEEKIEDQCLDFMIPVMLLQPLYENAIKHGVYESTETVRIITNARLTEEFMEITISNNYNPESFQKRGTGTGLSNVARRVELYYGNNASLRTSKENGMFTVSIYLPVQKP